MTGSLPPYIVPLGLLAGTLAIVLLIYFLLRCRALKTLYLQDPLFDGPSRSFYGLLDVAVRKHFNLFRNINVEAVIRSSGAVSPLPGKIRHTSFDLLLCDRRKMMPKCGIVLVDKGDAGRGEAKLLREFCDKVSLPLLVYETGGILDVSRLRRDVYQATGFGEKLGTDEVLGDSRGSYEKTSNEPKPAPQESVQQKEAPAVAEETSTADISDNDDSTRICTKCGADMAQRTITKGQYAGQQALVCEKFPDCRHAVLIRTLVAV